MRSVLLLALLAVSSASAQTPDPTPNQTAESFSREVRTTVAMRFLVALPETYDVSDEAWPLLLFLHGSGERGDSLMAVSVHGPPRLIRDGQALPFVVVSPQLPAGERWEPEALAVLLDEVEARYRIDPDRVYVTGLSLGGNGTWRLAEAYPDRFAAIAPVCGWGEVWDVCRGVNIPTWAFHGALDDIVPVERSESLVAALEACGGDARLTVYPEANHNSWTQTYANPALYEWLLSHRRGDTRPAAAGE